MITAGRTDRCEFARFQSETNRTISSPTDATRADVSEYFARTSRIRSWVAPARPGS